jgi:hypothetical protein
MWDEMRIKQFIEFDRHRDVLMGIVDHGKDDRILVPAKEALVFMIRGISGKWSFPVSYYFSAEATESNAIYHLFLQILDTLFRIGLRVRF